MGRFCWPNRAQRVWGRLLTLGQLDVGPCKAGGWHDWSTSVVPPARQRQSNSSPVVQADEDKGGATRILAGSAGTRGRDGACGVARGQILLGEARIRSPRCRTCHKTTMGQWRSSGVACTRAGGEAADLARGRLDPRRGRQMLGTDVSGVPPVTATSPRGRAQSIAPPLVPCPEQDSERV